MDKTTIKPRVNSESVVYLLSKAEASSLLGDAFASVFALNPTVTWVKFILTDDMVNGNGQRVPKTEFSNLISTGVNMPIKMALGEISPGHPETKPLGTMTHLREIITEDGRDAILAVAALWGQERPADVAYIKSRFEEGKPIDVSWEILYEEAEFNEALGSVDLHSTVLSAATIVGNPAYQGRTQFLSVAAKKWSKAYIEALPDTHFLYIADDGSKHLPIMDAENKLDLAKIVEAQAGLSSLNTETAIKESKAHLLEGLISRFQAGDNLDKVSEDFYKSVSNNTEESTLDAIQELQDKLAITEQKLNEALTALTEKETLLGQATAELSSVTEELTSLRDFKATLEAEAHKQEKLEALKGKFTEAGIVKPEEFYAENAEKLLKLEDDVLALMIEQLKPAQSQTNEQSLASASTQIPPLSDEPELDLTDVKVLAQILRDKRNKK